MKIQSIVNMSQELTGCFNDALPYIPKKMTSHKWDVLGKMYLNI